MIKEFKEFISHGNVVDLAVAVVVGAAFTAIVKSFSTDILGQLVAAVGGSPNLDDSFILPLRTITDAAGKESKIGIRFGALLTQIINFLIVSFAMFLVVKALNKAQTIRSTAQAEADTEADAAEANEIALLTEIRDLLQAQAAR